MWTLWESRVLCEISKPLWARSVRPQGWQHPHRLRPRENVQHCRGTSHCPEEPGGEITGDLEVDRGHDRGSWSILSGRFLAPTWAIGRITRIAPSSHPTAFVARTPPG